MKNNLGNLLKGLRKGRDYSLKDVEALSGVTASYVYRIEKGERKSPTVFILKKLADAYKCDLMLLVNAAVQDI